MMMTRRGLLSLFGVSAVVMLPACDVVFPVSYRFRMTIEVDTPEGVKRGSSVMEVRSSKEPFQIGDSNLLKNKLIGEAVAIRLPERYLFAIIGDTSSGKDLAEVVTYSLASRSKSKIPFWIAVKELGKKNQVGREVDLRSGNYPRFVTFDNIYNPNTVKTFNEKSLKSFEDKNIKVTKITIRITKDPISRSINKIIPWIDDIHGGYINNSKAARNSPLGLHGGDFTTEALK